MVKVRKLAYELLMYLCRTHGLRNNWLRLPKSLSEGRNRHFGFHAALLNDSRQGR